MARHVQRLGAGIMAAAVALSGVGTALGQGSSADSNNSDWWGSSSGWVTQPTSAFTELRDRRLIAEYKYWWEGTAPEAWIYYDTYTMPQLPWSGFGWSMPTPFFHPEEQPGPHDCNTEHYWRASGYQRNILAYLKKQTKSYAYAKDNGAPTIPGQAHARTRWKDPWYATQPAPGEIWSIAGGIAPRGELFASLEGGGGTAFLDTLYELSINGGPRVPVFNIHIVTNGLSPQVLLSATSDVQIARNGVDLTLPQIQGELLGFFTTPNHWLLSGDPGLDGTDGYYFNIGFHLPATALSAELFSTVTTGADHASPTPGAGAILATALGIVSLRRRRER